MPMITRHEANNPFDVLNGKFCREDVEALIPLAKTQSQARALRRLAERTISRDASEALRRALMRGDLPK